MLIIPTKDKIVFHWYIESPSTLSISNFVIGGKRGVGTGTKIYNEWESSLPLNFTKVELRARDRYARKFWLKMGFIDDFEVNEDGSSCMSKRLNRVIPND